MTLLIDLVFCEILYDSAAYHTECALRDEVLRRPLGLSLYDEDLSSEAAQMHFGLFGDNALLACIIAKPLSTAEVKLRQMAVAPDNQGRGYGRKLLELLNIELDSRGYVTATLHARASAVSFYKKLGFQAVGGEFMELGIPHRRMTKHPIT